MDDCNLKSLSIKSFQLTPAFKSDVLEYNVVVGSQIANITFSLETNDRSATYSIKNSDGGKTVPLKEGVNDIRVEVTSEDGSTKTYVVHARRLSAKDASLSGIKVNPGSINPDFAADVLEYTCLLPCNVTNVTVTPTVHDAKSGLKVNGAAPGSVTKLNVGQTIVSIEVTSPDLSKTCMYTLICSKKQIPRFVRLDDPSKATRFECPVSLAPLYQPISVKGSNPVHTYSGPIIDSFVRTSKIDPIGEEALNLDWRQVNSDVDRHITESIAFVPLGNGGISEKVMLNELGSRLKECSRSPVIQVNKQQYSSNVALNHTVQVRSWEKQLHQIFDESDPAKLVVMAEESINKYLNTRPAIGTRSWNCATGECPMDHLDRSAVCYSSAIKAKPKDATLHLRLGLTLEEKFVAQDILGLKKDRAGGKTGSAGINTDAKESSKAEECDAICELRGVTKNASLAQQLKAIDQEYHHLLEHGNSAKADHVQSLYAWKSKQAAKGGAMAQKASDEESPIGQAYLKYLDALSLDESKANHHFHVGRLLVVQGEYEAAVKRLGAALSINESLPMAKFFLGLALSLRKEGAGDRSREAANCLFDGVEAYLKHQCENSLSPDEQGLKGLYGENLLEITNVFVPRGMVQLGLLISSAGLKDCMSAVDMWHNAALSASRALSFISRGNTYQQLEWVLFDSHSLLLADLVSRKQNSSLISTRCECLSALIKRSTIPANGDLLQFQLKTCQMGTQIEPCNSRALYLLGNAQLALYDFQPDGPDAKQLLADSGKSFRASIALEGKPSSEGAPLSELTEQKWWQEKEKQKTNDSTKLAAAPGAAAAPQPNTGSVAPVNAALTSTGRGAPRGGGATARGGVGGGVTARGGGATARGGGATARGGPSTSTARGGAATAGRGAPSTRGTVGVAGAKAAPVSTTAKPSEPSSAPAPPVPVQTTAQSNVAKIQGADGVVKTNAAVNRPSFQSRLGLARVLSRDANADLAEVKKYYTAAIDMAPNEHSAYIEVAELLTQKDPMGAVDIYCRYPVPNNPTFDDAYIFGEIVRLLFKLEKFEDPRLLKNMIAMGKIMGVATIDKYVQILQSKMKTDFLKKLFAGINGKSVDDPEMIAFYKIKYWM